MSSSKILLDSFELILQICELYVLGLKFPLQTLDVGEQCILGFWGKLRGDWKGMDFREWH